MRNWKRQIGVATLVAGLLACGAASADYAELRTVRDYPAGAPAIARIHGWLLQQSRSSNQPKKITPPVTPADLGSVRVSTVSLGTPPGTRPDAVSDARPLPTRGRPGDEVRIDACNAGQRYHWVYTWPHVATAAAWQLTTYRQRTVADCTAPADEPTEVETGATS